MHSCCGNSLYKIPRTEKTRSREKGAFQVGDGKKSARLCEETRLKGQVGGKEMNRALSPESQLKPPRLERAGNRTPGSQAGHTTFPRDQRLSSPFLFEGTPPQISDLMLFTEQPPHTCHQIYILVFSRSSARQPRCKEPTRCKEPIGWHRK